MADPNTCHLIEKRRPDRRGTPAEGYLRLADTRGSGVWDVDALDLAYSTIAVLCQRCGQPKFAFRFADKAEDAVPNVDRALIQLQERISEFADLGRMVVVKGKTELTALNTMLASARAPGPMLFALSSETISGPADFNTDGWAHETGCKQGDPIFHVNGFEAIIPAHLLPEGFGNDVHLVSDRIDRLVSPFQPIPVRSAALVRPPVITPFELVTEAAFQTGHVMFDRWSWSDVAVVAWQLRGVSWHPGFDFDVTSELKAGHAPESVIVDRLVQTSGENASAFMCGEMFCDWKMRLAARLRIHGREQPEAMAFRLARFLIAVELMQEQMRIHWIARGSPRPYEPEFELLAREIGLSFVRRLP